MQLYDSLTRAKVELPQPPGRCGCTSVGRRSTSGSTSATPLRRLHVASALAGQREYDVTLVEHHRHQRQDLPGRARDSARLAADASR